MRHPSRFLLCLVALLCLALAPSCGGSGGDKGTTAGGGGGAGGGGAGGGGGVGGATGSGDTIGWLARLNNMRAWAGLAPVTEDASLQQGGDEHCIYMVRNDVIEHAQDLGACCKTAAGLNAAQNSNLSISGGIPGLQVERPLRSWMTGPFHGIGMIDPRLSQSSFSNYYELTGSFHHGAALDVLSNRNAAATGYPIMWPGNGAVVDILSYDGFESPDPLASAPFSAPCGLPIYLQLGSGGVTPSVTASTFSEAGGAPLPHIVFDETTYSNPNGAEQSLGRAVLGGRDCVVLMPQAPLQAGKTYNVSITSNGTVHAWSFSTDASASKRDLEPMKRVMTPAPQPQK